MNRRLVGAGASGLALVFAVAPFAHADEVPPDAASSSAPADDTPTSAVPSSDTPTSAVPSSGTPTSAVPSSDTPTSAVPSSDTPTSDVPSSTTPTSDVPSSAPDGSTQPSSSAPSSIPASSSAPAAPPADRKRTAAPKADFGLGKSTSTDANVTVRVDKAAGTYAPADAGTGGSTVTIVQRDSGDALVSTTECTTVADATGAGSSCPTAVAVPDGNTLQITQDSAAAAFVVAAPVDAGPFSCADSDDEDGFLACEFGRVPAVVTVSLADNGLPPGIAVADTTVTVPADEASTVDVDEQQVDTHGAPPSSVDVTTDPTHGTVAVVTDSPARVRAAVVTPVTGAFHFLYTPTTGYIGPDSFQYTVTTANGTSAVATVDLKVVGAAPTAHNDRTSTKQGASVVEDVLANDTANGGGTLTLDAVTEARHGTAEIVDGKVRYTPAPDFSGTDAFGYTATTYSGTASATVTVTVVAPATVTPTPTPTTPAPTTSGSTGAAPADADVTTADTGTPSAALIEIGGALLLAGASATVIGRRRRPSGGHG